MHATAPVRSPSCRRRYSPPSRRWRRSTSRTSSTWSISAPSVSSFRSMHLKVDRAADGTPRPAPTLRRAWASEFLGVTTGSAAGSALADTHAGLDAARRPALAAAREAIARELIVRRPVADAERVGAAGERRPAPGRARVGAPLQLPARQPTRRSSRRSRTSLSNGSISATGRRSSATGPYLVPLIEELRLPAEIRAKANPKSSTGRLDVFTRVLTDRNHRFDEIAAGYHGKLYLEVVPRTFAIRVQTGLALNQVRLMVGRRAPRGRRAGQRCTRARRCCTLDSAALPRARAVARRRAVPQPRRVRLRREHRRLPRQEEQPADRPHRAPAQLQVARLLGAGPPRAGQADRARARGLLSAAVRRGREHPAVLRRRDARLRPHRRRAAHALRRLLRPGLRLLADAPSPRQPRRARGPRARRLVHGRAPPAGLQARVRAHGEPPECSTARTSAPTTRAS